MSHTPGEQSTAFNPRAVRALKKAGLTIEKQSETDNPIYRVTYAEQAVPIEAFSKTFSHDVNPHEDFCAVMTCSQADAACPFVRGAQERIAIPYDDPKAFDGTDQEEAKYDERCRQIAREMFYVFAKAKSV